MTKLHRYLQRIGYTGPLAPTHNALHNLHRAHLLAVPFENLDVQLGVRRPFTIEAAYEKIVDERRGGWCYEMNGLFAWALRELGFTVDLLGGAVNREKNGDQAIMNHLVHLDEPFLADVGFGNGMLTPARLRVGHFNDGRFDFRLAREGEWWRFYNHRHDGSSYDFTERPYEYSAFEPRARILATTAESSFVQNLTAMRLTDDGFVTLTNATLQTYTPKEMRQETAPTAIELVRILRENFELEVDRTEALWNRVSTQQKAWTKRKLRGF